MAWPTPRPSSISTFGIKFTATRPENMVQIHREGIMG